MSLTSDSTADEWERAARLRQRSRSTTRSSNTNSTNTSTSSTPPPPFNSLSEHGQIVRTQRLAKQAGLEASIMANQISEQKEARKNADIKRLMRNDRASPVDRARFMSIYDDDIREEVNKSRGTPPIKIPVANNRQFPPTYRFGGRTKRRSRKSRKGKRTKKGKHVRKSKKTKRGKSSKRR